MENLLIREEALAHAHLCSKMACGFILTSSKWLEKKKYGVPVPVSECGVYARKNIMCLCVSYIAKWKRGIVFYLLTILRIRDIILMKFGKK